MNRILGSKWISRWRVILPAISAILVSLVFIFNTSRSHTVKGEAFIANEDGSIRRLPLKKVSVYPRSVVLKHLSDARAEFDAASREEKGELSTQLKTSDSRGPNYFLLVSLLENGIAHKFATILWRLPKPTSEVVTDSSGQFTISVPNANDYVLVATGITKLTKTLSVSDDLSWIISAEGQAADSRLILSNHNLIRVADFDELMRKLQQ